MKPIHIVSISGQELMPTLGTLQQTVNSVFEKRNFSFKQISVVTGKGNPTFALPNGGSLFTVFMVLEAASMKDIDELMEWDAKDGDNPPPGSGMKAVE